MTVPEVPRGSSLSRAAKASRKGVPCRSSRSYNQSTGTCGSAVAAAQVAVRESCEPFRALRPAPRRGAQGVAKRPRPAALSGSPDAPGSAGGAVTVTHPVTPVGVCRKPKVSRRQIVAMEEEPLDGARRSTTTAPSPSCRARSSSRPDPGHSSSLIQDSMHPTLAT